MILTTEKIPFNKFGYINYRIEIKYLSKYKILQRHIWELSTGAIEIQDWISSSFRDKEISFFTDNGFTKKQ